MVPTASPRHIVSTHPGPGTAVGQDDIVIDNYGTRYRRISEAEAEQIRNSTGGIVYTLDRDGNIR